MTEATALRIADALDRIATALEPPVAEPAPTPDQVGVCLHPEKSRVNFGSMGLADGEWECARAKGGCGFRSPALVACGG